MAKTNLSLGNLYRATVGTARTSQSSSLNQRNGSAGTQVSFGSFAIDSVTINQPTYTYIVESTTETATFTFGSPGSVHGTRVGSVANNYTVSFDNSNFSVGAPTLGASPSFPVTPAAISQTTYSEASATLTMSYADGYNINATNYNTISTKTLYAVDVYNTINEPDFCLLFGTQVEMADGTMINVEDLRIGDTIKAWVPDGLPDENAHLDQYGNEIDWRFYTLDVNTGSSTNVTITDLVFNFASLYYSINYGTIRSTGTHPLWVWDSQIGKYTFKIVEDIIVGDKLIRYDDTNGLIEIEVYDILIIREDTEIVTINVETVDTFLSNGLVSHNKGATTQPSIPASGLVMYLDPSKAYCFPGQTLPSTGNPTTDWLDVTGYNTGVRPSAQPPLSLGTNPSYNAGATRKEKYFALNGSDQMWYKDTASNINGGYSNFNTNNGTIHIWVRPTTTLGTTSRYLFDYAGYFGIAIESSNSSALDRLQFYGSSLGNSGQKTISLSSNVWYLISVSFQPSGTVTLYVDGSSVGTFTASAFTAPTSTNYIAIGSNSGRTSIWNGQVGPVLFYNTIQNSTKVQQVYNYFSPTYK